MFTGIVKNTGTVRAIDKDGECRLTIETGMDLTKTPEGASIACSGVCLTVVEKGNNWFAATVSGETLSKTTIKAWHEGMVINLEPSLHLGDEIGGHFVFGHVDGVVEIKEIKEEGESHVLTIAQKDELRDFIASKGSVSLDGVSLTVNDVTEEVFTVNIIPYTWAHTTLGQKKPGDFLNIEVDMLARYVARMLNREAA